MSWYDISSYVKEKILKNASEGDMQVNKIQESNINGKIRMLNQKNDKSNNTTEHIHKKYKNKKLKYRTLM